MPSSMIFVSLVFVWLLILVPAVARRQQEVARPSAAALSGRVLSRPIRRRSSQEVAQMDLSDDRAVASRTDNAMDDDEAVAPEEDVTVPAARVPGDDEPPAARGRADAHRDAGPDGSDLDDGTPDEQGREGQRPPARYRPGRGGFDPEAAALAARARYAVRQRIVLGLLVALLVSALVSLFAATSLWWLTALVGACLAGYLGYLRRQVRLEEAIRDRRAARMAGTRRPAAADDPEVDEWAGRDRDAATPDAVGDIDDTGAELDGDDDGWADAAGSDATGSDAADSDDGADDDGTADLDDGDPTRVRGVGEPIGVLPARPRKVAATEDDADDEIETALPRLAPTPPPPLPAGTSVVSVDEEELELSELKRTARPGYRRAVGE